MKSHGIRSLQVTGDDIDKGTVSGRWCPIARAGQRAFRTAEVTYRSEVLTVGDTRYRVVGGSDFAHRFDLGQPVAPRRFRLVSLDTTAYLGRRRP
jgi:hypothetical protein